MCRFCYTQWMQYIYVLHVLYAQLIQYTAYTYRTSYVYCILCIQHIIKSAHLSDISACHAIRSQREVCKGHTKMCVYQTIWCLVIKLWRHIYKNVGLHVPLTEYLFLLKCLSFMHAYYQQSRLYQRERQVTVENWSGYNQLPATMLNKPKTSCNWYIESEVNLISTEGCFNWYQTKFLFTDIKHYGLPRINLQSIQTRPILQKKKKLYRFSYIFGKTNTSN